MKGPILVVLAAGMGSRYGGLKQIDKIGPAGEALLDYSVFDALRAGFEKIVFIIRKDIEKDFTEYVLKRMNTKVPYALAFQDPDLFVPKNIQDAAKKNGRTKPWGTCHALLCAESQVDAPFSVINADDFYGRGAYDAMGALLKNPAFTDGAIVPYRLEDTLSPTGTVTRGVCVFENGLLSAVDELKSIQKHDGVIFNTDENGKRRELAADTPVSMNFWGFPAGIFTFLHRYFDDFLSVSGTELKSECFIPLAADCAIKQNLLKIHEIKADSEWFGITYKEDRDAAVARLSALTAANVYPQGLWS